MQNRLFKMSRILCPVCDSGSSTVDLQSFVTFIARCSELCSATDMMCPFCSQGALRDAPPALRPQEGIILLGAPRLSK